MADVHITWSNLVRRSTQVKRRNVSKYALEWFPEVAHNIKAPRHMAQ